VCVHVHATDLSMGWVSAWAVGHHRGFLCVVIWVVGNFLQGFSNLGFPTRSFMFADMHVDLHSKFCGNIFSCSGIVTCVWMNGQQF
jgi:hypothetical protein